MCLISWNTARRVAAASRQAAAVIERSPDIVVLQEVTAVTLERLLPLMSMGGLGHSLVTCPPRAPQSKARDCVAVFSRYPLTRIEDRVLDLPWSEKVLPVRVTLPGVALEIYGAHVPPGSSNGWKKVETLEGIYSALARHSDAPRILCGDFNTPQSELADGSCVTWAQKVRPDGTVRRKRRIRHGDGQRWDAAERNVLRGLESHGFSDVFRELHGHQPGYSFVLRRKSHVAQRRFDHLLLSGPVSASVCRYIHVWREDRLSDHSAIEAELVLHAPA